MQFLQKSSAQHSNTTGAFEDSATPSQNEEIYVPACRRSRRMMNISPQMPEEVQDLKKYNYSFWSNCENLAYMRFLEQNAHLFDSNWRERKDMKINVIMSNHIKTRSSLQCRSHHQKMMKQHKNIPQIIKSLQKLTQNAQIEWNEENQSGVEVKQIQKRTDTDLILQDLCEKLRWAQEQSDFWQRITNQSWLNDIEY